MIFSIFLQNQYSLQIDFNFYQHLMHTSISHLEKIIVTLYPPSVTNLFPCISSQQNCSSKLFTWLCILFLQFSLELCPYFLHFSFTITVSEYHIYDSSFISFIIHISRCLNKVLFSLLSLMINCCSFNVKIKESS